MSTIQSIIYNLWHFSDLIVIVHYVSVLCCNMFCLFAARKTRVFPASVHLGADSPSFLCLFWEIFTLRCVDFVLMLKQISFFCHQLSPSLSLSIWVPFIFFRLNATSRFPWLLAFCICWGFSYFPALCINFNYKL